MCVFKRSESLPPTGFASVQRPSGRDPVWDPPRILHGKNGSDRTTLIGRQKKRVLINRSGFGSPTHFGAGCKGARL
jgi:hypothetical protein